MILTKDIKMETNQNNSPEIAFNERVDALLVVTRKWGLADE